MTCARDGSRAGTGVTVGISLSAFWISPRLVFVARAPVFVARQQASVKPDGWRAHVLPRRATPTTGQ